MIWRKKLTWKVEWDDRARKELRKLDQQLQKDILKYLRERITAKDNPRRFGKSLCHNKYGLWRYRVQNVRIICKIEDEEFIVLVVKVGNRKNVYND